MAEFDEQGYDVNSTMLRQEKKKHGDAYQHFCFSCGTACAFGDNDFADVVQRE